MNYKDFLKSKSKDKWKRIGIKRRSGVVVPLFSVYSKNSFGIGEYTDLKLVIDWCNKTGISIIQLLPINDTGFTFSPYSSISSFALDPMYLSLTQLDGVNKQFVNDLISQVKFKQNKTNKVDYSIKKLKLDILREIFCELKNNLPDSFYNFAESNEYWLINYSAYSIINEKVKSGLINSDFIPKKKEVIRLILDKDYNKFEFYQWIQWQIFEQLSEVKRYAEKNKVLIMGDLPLLVSRESADVWANPEYFIPELSAGAPPDMFFAFGQDWGMPPYNWENIEADNFTYFKERLKYAENFYDMFRIDHFIGLFRIWTTEYSKEYRPEEVVKSGKFIPEDENQWVKQGDKIIKTIIKSTKMLPCAEDLGTVPECSYHILNKYSIPGTDFQRYLKNKNYNFLTVNKFRNNSISVLSTHDSSIFINWWNYEASTINESLFDRLFKEKVNDLKIENVKNKLFDLKKSKFGNLYWNKNIKSQADVLNILGLNIGEGDEFVLLFNNSYHEKKKYLKLFDNIIKSQKSSTQFVYYVLEMISKSSSVFNIQLIQDWLSLDSRLIRKMNNWGYRINFPGTISENNWSLKLPVSLEKMLELDINKTVKRINKLSKRA